VSLVTGSASPARYAFSKESLVRIYRSGYISPAADAAEIFSRYSRADTSVGSSLVYLCVSL
jgi:hypothetical protein